MEKVEGMRFKTRLYCSVASILFVVGAASVSQAQEVSAGCFAGPAKLSSAEVTNFTQSPNNLLSEFPTAGLPLSSRVRSLVGSSGETLDPVLALVGPATGAQKSAIGAGLARVAKSCSTVSPEYAQLIQQKVAAANDSALTTAFMQASNEVQTAALGGAGGAGGAAGAGAAGLAGGGSINGSTGSTGGDSSTASGDSSFAVGSSGSFTEGEQISARQVSP